MEGIKVSDLIEESNGILDKIEVILDRIDKNLSSLKSDDEKKRDEVERLLEKIGVINYEIATDKIIDILK